MSEKTEDKINTEHLEDQNLFERTSDETRSTTDRLVEKLDRKVLTPSRIAWSDLRTRIGILILLGYVVIALVGMYVTDGTSTGDGPRLAQPFQSLQHPLGTDHYGQDLMIMLIEATPAMLEMIIAGAVFTTIVATIVGSVSGYLAGSKVDRLLMFITDVMLTLPGLPLVIVITAIFAPRQPAVVGIFLAINAWAGLARSIRSEVLSIRQESYVEASNALGLSTASIVRHDIVPNIMPYVTINFANSSRNIIYSSVALYFLGVLPVTNLNWGVILNQAPNIALRDPAMRHWIVMPLLTIMIISAAFILIAQGADRMFNPRLQAKHAKTIEEDEEP